MLYARAFVPINDAKYHRRACTWPMIDAHGLDVAYLTLEFSFVSWRVRSGNESKLHVICPLCSLTSFFCGVLGRFLDSLVHFQYVEATAVQHLFVGLLN